MNKRNGHNAIPDRIVDMCIYLQQFCNQLEDREYDENDECDLRIDTYDMKQIKGNGRLIKYRVNECKIPDEAKVQMIMGDLHCCENE
jgi:hypothetical protein